MSGLYGGIAKYLLEKLNYFIAFDKSWLERWVYEL